ncbi:MAG TPA: type I-C CRISPR-associated protein Cas5 [Lentisphaeria bacterium]|nr:type I-C CRISPR-associated protein Cas5 [Lentisphaeria bacterium]HCG49248.1 type I-C CRISPR-associated protein Cas5 [Lentisphaeria bacterium]
MGYGIKLLVWGDRASFNRPEMKVERVTYDVMTPSAARGILEAIYWKPQMKWVIDRIHVLNPIRFSNIRRNELGGKIAVNMKNTSDGSEMGVLIAENRQQRAGIILLNVKYGIEAHIDVVEKDRTNEHSGAKHLEMFKRRASNGQYFHHPYFGNREFPVNFELVEEFPKPHEELKDTDFGYMLNDMVFTPDKKGRVVESSQGRRLSATPVFFRAKMKNGVIEVPPAVAEMEAAV